MTIKKDTPVRFKMFGREFEATLHANVGGKAWVDSVRLIDDTGCSEWSDEEWKAWRKANTAMASMVAKKAYLSVFGGVATMGYFDESDRSAAARMAFENVMPRQEHVEAVKVSWSPRGLCSCGCSPAFLLKRADGKTLRNFCVSVDEIKEMQRGALREERVGPGEYVVTREQ